jgi:hypothetical protein
MIFQCNMLGQCICTQQSTFKGYPGRGVPIKSFKVAKWDGKKLTKVEISKELKSKVSDYFSLTEYDCSSFHP